VKLEASRPAEAAGHYRNFVSIWPFSRQPAHAALNLRGIPMNQIIYLIGLIVVIMAVLSLLGLR
jgi:hypothetical protein